MPFGNRKLFLMFLSAMTLSIIIMVIIYGLFIKDYDFSFNVKQPDTAPSPIDRYEEQTEANLDPAKVSTPENQEKLKDEDAQTAEEPLPVPESDKITDVLPLSPQLNDNNNESAALEGEEGTESSANTLHYVYLDGFSSKESAEQAIQQLQSRSVSVQPYVRQHRGQVILQFGVFSDRENAEVMAQQLRNQHVYVKVD